MTVFRLLSKAFGVAGYILQYGCITHCTFEYLGDFVVCIGPSMEPTLYSNNVLLTERVTPRLNRIHRGDIIIAKCPTNPQQHVCKRVVGLPGDRILTEPAVHFNRFHLKKHIANKSTQNLDIQIQTAVEDEAVKTTTLITKKLQNEIVVPRGHVWIEGDNSANSADSRYYGPVPHGLIKSRAICRLWPLNDMKALI